MTGYFTIEDHRYTDDEELKTIPMLDATLDNLLTIYEVLHHAPFLTGISGASWLSYHCGCSLFTFKPY